MSDGVIVDDKKVLEAFGRLSDKQMNKAYRQALKKAIEPISKQAKSNLRKSGIKNVSKKYVGKNGRTYGSMVSGIKTSVDVRNPGEEWSKVHIMGDFRLKWFEKGTQLRKTNKGWNRGSISAKWFFRDAINQKSKECLEQLDDLIKQSILKAYNK